MLIFANYAYLQTVSWIQPFAVTLVKTRNYGIISIIPWSKHYVCGSRGIPLSTLHLFYQVLVTQCHLFYQMLVTQCHNSHKQFINGCQMFLNLTPYPKRWSKNFDQVCEVTTLLFNNPHSVNMVQKSHNSHKQPVATCFTKDSD